MSRYDKKITTAPVSNAEPKICFGCETVCFLKCSGNCSATCKGTLNMKPMSTNK